MTDEWPEEWPYFMKSLWYQAWVQWSKKATSEDLYDNIKNFEAGWNARAAWESQR